MRAVQAAKANSAHHNGEHCYISESPEAEVQSHVSDVPEVHTALALESLFNSALSVLKPLLDEAASQDSAMRTVPLAFWILDRAGAPQHLVQELRDCAQQGKFQPQGSSRPSSRISRPSGTPALEGSPKKKALKSRVDGPTGGEIEEVPALGERTPGSIRSCDRKPSFSMDEKTMSWKKSKSSQWKRTDSDSEDSVQGGFDTEGSFQSVIAEEDALENFGEDDEEQPRVRRKSRKKKTLLTADPKTRIGTRSSVSHLKPMGSPRRERRFTINMTKSVQEMPSEEKTLELLRKVPELQKYSDDDLKKIIDIAQCHKYEAEENLLNQGVVADELHVIVEGSGKVSIPYQISSFAAGDYFGEEALRLAVANNTVQVTASGGPVTTVSINRKEFQKLHLKQANLAKAQVGEKKGGRGRDQELQAADAKRNGTCMDTGHPVIADYTVNEADRDVIAMAIKNNKMLGEVLELSHEQRDLIADSVYVISVRKGQKLMSEGQQGSCLFIVQEGLLEIHVAGKLQGEVKLRTGDSFGEIALLYETPRSATVVAVKDTKLWVLTRADYRVVTSLAQRKRMAEYTNFLKPIPAISSSVEEVNLQMVAHVLEKVTFNDGEELCVEGQDEGLLFVIYEGECDVTKEGEDIKILKSGDWIGEDQLLHLKPAEFTVTPRAEKVSALVLEAGSLGAVVKAIEEMKKTTLRSALKQPASSAGGEVQRKASTSVVPVSEAISKEKFTQEYIKKRMSKMIMKKRSSMATGLMEHDIFKTRSVGVLGEGSFGQVLLLEHKLIPDTRYALKILSKDHIQEEGMGSSVQNERSVMHLLDSPFIVKLYQSYQDDRHIIFMLEPALGGELFDLFYEHDLYGNVNMCRFVTACVTEGLQHMHANRVIWRDLKMENCLLDAQGYVKLTDMGIAKIVMGKTYTICGTADYFAPETLRQSGHDRAVDWWALGVLLFMMVTGRSPFDAQQVTQIYKNIMKGFSKVIFPDNVPSDLVEAVKSLCRKKPEERITMQKGGVNTFMEMPFFTGFDWDSLRAMTLLPPFHPPPPDFEKIKNRKLDRPREVNYDTIVPWDGSLPEAH